MGASIEVFSGSSGSSLIGVGSAEVASGAVTALRRPRRTGVKDDTAAGTSVAGGSEGLFSEDVCSDSEILRRWCRLRGVRSDSSISTGSDSSLSTVTDAFLAGFFLTRTEPSSSSSSSEDSKLSADNVDISEMRRDRRRLFLDGGCLLPESSLEARLAFRCPVDDVDVTEEGVADLLN